MQVLFCSIDVEESMSLQKSELWVTQDGKQCPGSCCVPAPTAMGMKKPGSGSTRLKNNVKHMLHRSDHCQTKCHQHLVDGLLCNGKHYQALLVSFFNHCVQLGRSSPQIRIWSIAPVCEELGSSFGLWFDRFRLPIFQSFSDGKYSQTQEHGLNRIHK